MKTLQILLVEDNPGDAELTRDSFELSSQPPAVQVVADGAEALRFLLRKPPFSTVMPPDMVLLDLNLPKINGRQVLAELRQHDELRHIPVVVLTSSDAAGDIVDCYKLGANCYLQKPVDLDAFQAMLRSLESFWFDTVKLPP